MRWISDSKSIRQMEKKHEERRLRLKAEVESLFKDDEEVVTFSAYQPSLNSNAIQQHMQLQQLAMAQAAQPNQMAMSQQSLMAQSQAANYSSQGIGGLGQTGLGSILGGLF